MACTLFAIQRLGLSSAAGIWCGTASVVSFTFAVKASCSNVLIQHSSEIPCAVVQALTSFLSACALAHYSSLLMCAVLTLRKRGLPCMHMSTSHRTVPVKRALIPVRLHNCSASMQVKGDHIQIPGLAVPGLLLLVAGLIGIATNGQIASRQNHRQASACPSCCGCALCCPLRAVSHYLTPLLSKRFPCSGRPGEPG